MVQAASSQSLSGADHWRARAANVLPAAGFGNFDPSMILARGEGSRVWDEDGNEYIDLLIGSGPMILGHGNPEVAEAVAEQMGKGLTFFTNNSAGIELAEEIVEAVACAEQVRYISTGGEADMYAMRLARAFTGRHRILKFEGGYHGMSAEALMSLAPQKLVNFPNAVPDSAGIPKSVEEGMVIAPYNDLGAVRELLDQFDGEVAGIIVEPLQRIIPPVEGFLAGLREEATRRGIVLIFDEVVTGFRFTYGGAQAYYGVEPDLCSLGKIIGGGFPLAAVAGRADIMAHFDKAKVGADGFALQIGTLSGNPVASVAGLKTMEILRRDGMYDAMAAKGEVLMSTYGDALGAKGIAHQIVGEPWLFDCVFSPRAIEDYRGVLGGDGDLAKAFNASMRASGILKADAKIYTHAALTAADMDQIQSAIHTAARAL
ncbi:MAG: aminotransferase class III-fold pyridoxal phosphate-dependent enzyme [Alphaproteobacteria bacterium TMED89]|nr:aspartate aminotransferase family protein [Rhodospirillaceae bacterium]RPH10205.1 MAG: aminotransferase class III-fold pyridoxal phosphate-dependent enzyme [Alphaproteobacteria bacterium TMED89]